ncbi:D-aminoacyl-tRNA deacylase [Spirochaetota bacterium]|nr:D-aminoacyl-tRNA deacylase [Spirochaetota bacterium]
MKLLVQRVLAASLTFKPQQPSPAAATPRTVERTINHGLLVYQSLTTADANLSPHTLSTWGANLMTFKFFSEDFVNRLDGNNDCLTSDPSTTRLTLSLNDVAGSLLLVSQITLYGQFKNQRKPSYTESAPPHSAKEIYERFYKILQESLPPPGKVQSGSFGAHMDIRAILDGPVTFSFEVNS